jgi:hypothetical protein
MTPGVKVNHRVLGDGKRLQLGVNLTDRMAGEGKPSTATLLSANRSQRARTARAGNLSWLRYDWFKRPELKKQIQDRYG